MNEEKEKNLNETPAPETPAADRKAEREAARAEKEAAKAAAAAEKEAAKAAAAAEKEAARQAKKAQEAQVRRQAELAERARLKAQAKADAESRTIADAQKRNAVVGALRSARAYAKAVGVDERSLHGAIRDTFKVTQEQIDALMKEGKL